MSPLHLEENPMPSNKTLTIRISGSSSSGKTTSIALLSQILPREKTLFIVADAFGKDFDEFPEHDGSLDADSRDSFHYDRLHRSVDYAKEYGKLPDDHPQHEFIENDLKKATNGLIPDFVGEMKDLVNSADIPSDHWKSLIVVDGILLYHDPSILSKIDIRIFLRTSKAEAERRRFGRYADSSSLQGDDNDPDNNKDFWKTRWYFEKFVWRNYAKEHAFMFPGRDVDAEGISDEAQKSGILAPEKLDMSSEETLRWEIRTLVKEMKRISELE